MGEVSKRHHTVPNFYLKGFASDNSKPQIGVVSLSDGKRFVLPTKDATVQTNFYALPGHPDGDDVFEKELSNLEGDAATVVRKNVEGTWPLSRDDREILGTFLALQFLRGPDTRAMMSQMQSTVLSKAVTQMGMDGLQSMLATSGKQVSDEKLLQLVEQATKPDGIATHASSAEHIDHLLELVPVVVRFFVGRPWNLVRFSRQKLLTCDTPVALIRDPKLEGFYAGVGVMNAWGISVPLTREIGLLLSDPMSLYKEDGAGQGSMESLLQEILNGGEDQTLNASTKIARFFNATTIKNARNWVFHHPDDAALVPDELPGPRDREVESEVISS
jgi:hypothetical protein